MNNHHSVFKKEWQTLLILSIYLILGIYLIKYYQYTINPDGISYINIAHEYISRDFNDAINGYWGPLFSWLLTPFLVLGSTPVYSLYSTKILSLIIGFFTLVGVKRLSNKFEIDKQISVAILLSLIPIVLFFAFSFITSDLLIVCIFIFYLSTVFDPKYSTKWFNAVSCGLLGALAYLSKSYAFPFFLVHFIFFNLFYYSRETKKKEKKNLLKNLLLGLTIFSIISGVWIGIISDKYDELTIGTAGTYNQAIVSPELQGNQFYDQYLMKPPNKNAISIWEDPSYIKIKTWNPLSSLQSFEYQLKLILGNTLNTINIFESFSLLSLLIIIISLLFIFKAPIKRPSKDKLMYLLITILIYSGGYSLILVEGRYLWIIYILLMITGGFLLNISFKIGILNKSIMNILLILLMTSFIVLPADILIQGINNDAEEIYNLSQTLKNYNVHGNIASNDESGLSLYLSYYLGCKYYGETKKINNSSNLLKELNENNIDYYFVWRNSKENIYLPPHFKEITNGNITNLRIYSLKN